MSELYNRIDKLCKEKGVSITAMCKDAKVSRSSLTDLKSGRSKELSTEALAKIADYFKVTMDYLSTGETNSDVDYLDDETRDLIDTLRKRPEMRTLFKAARDATREDIEAASDIIERFKKGSGG